MRSTCSKPYAPDGEDPIEWLLLTYEVSDEPCVIYPSVWRHPPGARH